MSDSDLKFFDFVIVAQELDPYDEEHMSYLYLEFETIELTNVCIGCTEEEKPRAMFRVTQRGYNEGHATLLLHKRLSALNIQFAQKLS